MLHVCYIFTKKKLGDFRLLNSYSNIYIYVFTQYMEYIPIYGAYYGLLGKCWDSYSSTMLR